MLHKNSTKTEEKKVHKKWTKSAQRVQKKSKNVPKEPKILHKLESQVNGFPKKYDTYVITSINAIPPIIPSYKPGGMLETEAEDFLGPEALVCKFISYLCIYV